MWLTVKATKDIIYMLIIEENCLDKRLVTGKRNPFYVRADI